MEIIFAVADRPACRALVVEVAGACVREGVIAMMQGFRGAGGSVSSYKSHAA